MLGGHGFTFLVSVLLQLGWVGWGGGASWVEAGWVRRLGSGLCVGLAGVLLGGAHMAGAPACALDCGCISAPGRSRQSALALLTLGHPSLPRSCCPPAAATAWMWCAPGESAPAAGTAAVHTWQHAGHRPGPGAAGGACYMLHRHCSVSKSIELAVFESTKQALRRWTRLGRVESKTSRRGSSSPALSAQAALHPWHPGAHAPGPCSNTVLQPKKSGAARGSLACLPPQRALPA